jgi:hypothetical protein
VIVTFDAMQPSGVSSLSHYFRCEVELELAMLTMESNDGHSGRTLQKLVDDA